MLNKEYLDELKLQIDKKPSSERRYSSERLVAVSFVGDPDKDPDILATRKTNLYLCQFDHDGRTFELYLK